MDLTLNHWKYLNLCKRDGFLFSSTMSPSSKFNSCMSVFWSIFKFINIQNFNYLVSFKYIKSLNWKITININSKLC